MVYDSVVVEPLPRKDEIVETPPEEPSTEQLSLEKRPPEEEGGDSSFSEKTDSAADDNEAETQGFDNLVEQMDLD